MKIRVRVTRWPWAVLVSMPAILGLGPTSAARAQASPNGGQFQVNTYTTGVQVDPALAADPLGNFVVAWSSVGSSGSDSINFSVQAQRYAANGAPLGGQFQVNTYTTSYQFEPAVASDSQGNFVVAWASFGSSGSDTSLTSIQAQRYATNGAPLGGEFQVNTYTTSAQRAPAVAMDSLGNFVVAWQSYGSSGTDTDNRSVQARRYDANGVPLNDQFQVNSYTTSVQAYPAVAADPQGNFVVAWQSYGSSGTDASYASIQAQRYAANGAPLGGEFQVNTFTPSAQLAPAAAADSQGDFVVAWMSNGSSGSDTSLFSIQARRYASGGTPLGGESQVNTYTTATQVDPVVGSDSQGNFVVAWVSNGSSGSDTIGFSVQARHYAADGVPLGGEFQVNSYTTNGQTYAGVASDASGNFVVAWASDGSAGSDTSAVSIQAQRYDGLFRDGFGSGTTGRWSSAVP